MILGDIVQNRKVGVFLCEDSALVDALKNAGAREVAWYTHEADAGDDRISWRLYRHYTGFCDVGRNNADVLMLDRGALMAVRSFRYFGHASFLLVPLALGSLWVSPLLIRYVMRNRLRFHGMINFSMQGARTNQWLVFENINRKFIPGPRLYISIEGGMRGIAESFRGLKYCFLRGHRQFGDLVSLSDLDILVSNDNAEELCRRINRRLGFFPIETYTVFSVPGHSQRNDVAYLPPARASEMLDRCIEGEFGERRPTVRDTLLSYCYHLLFHKRIMRVEPSDKIGPDTWGKRDYYDELMRLYDEAVVPRLLTIEEMAELLRREGWFPAEEALKQISRSNEFVRRRFYDRAPSYRPGLVVFVQREIAARYDLFDPIQRMVEESGFQILCADSIPEEMRFHIASEFRGGNWAKNGMPVHFIVAFDPDPLPVTPAKMPPQYRQLDNRRILAKEEIRKKTIAITGVRGMNALHASDNSREALHYLRILRPKLHQTWQQRLRI